MSRLIQLLNEKEVVAGSRNENGKEYLLNTPAGNLFRLLLVVNPHQPILQTGSQNLVSKMLDSIYAENEKVIKSLQTSYNKIKKLSLVGKKVTVNIKKEYFDDLFTLLLPMTGQSNFKQNTLVANFSGNTTQHHTFQRRAIVLIGKALLANKDVELNDRDKTLIKGYIAGMDALDGIHAEKDDSPENIEDVTTMQDASVAPAQSKTAVSKVVNEETSDEKLKDVASKAAIVKKGIRGLHDDKSAALGELLRTNESVEPFKVTLTGNDEPFNNLVNTKMAHFYESTKVQHGTEVANFITKMFSDAMRHLNDENGYLSFVQGEVDMHIEKIDKGLRVSMKTGGSVDREHQFFMVKSFRDEGGKFIVNHDKIQVPAGAQKTGINKKIFKDVLELYKAEGVDKITLEANVDVGGYAWFRYGFVPQDAEQLDSIAVWIEAVAPLVVSATKYDSKDLAQFIENNSYTKSKGINNLVNLIKTGYTPQTEKVINGLFQKCADELRETFDDKSKFKGLAKNIAVMNFKEYKIAGNVYSISYKALLSIQSLTANGTKVIPMVSGVYLHWLGELDMKDLDNTHAYLNMKKG